MPKRRYGDQKRVSENSKQYDEGIDTTFVSFHATTLSHQSSLNKHGAHNPGKKHWEKAISAVALPVAVVAKSIPLHPLPFDSSH